MQSTTSLSAQVIVGSLSVLIVKLLSQGVAVRPQLSIAENSILTVTDNVTVIDIDKIRFEVLGGTISNECNPVIITAEDVTVGDDPADCMDDFTVIRTYTISDQVTEVTCVTTYEIIYTPLQILSFPPATIVDCSENIDSIFALWLEDFGGTRFQGCANILDITPEPVIAFNPGCLNTPSSSPNERGNVRIKWDLQDDCLNEKSAIASFVVVDNTAPTITCPDDRTYNIQNPDLISDIDDYLSTAETFEQCGDARLETNFTMSSIAFDCQPVQDITVFLTARDTCNNFSFCETVISVVNDAVADIICPNDITIECGDPNNQAIIKQKPIEGKNKKRSFIKVPPVKGILDPIASVAK